MNLLHNRYQNDKIPTADAVPSFEFDESLELAVEADNLLAAMDTCDVAIVGLEGIADQVQASLSGGGLDVQGAVMATAGIQGVMNTFGVDLPEVGTESWDAAGGRMVGTEAILADAADFIKEVWETIKRLVKEWVQKISDFYQKHLGRAQSITKAAKALRIKADGMSGSPEKAKVSLSGGLRQSLSIKGSFDESKVVDGIKDIGASVEGVAGNLAGVKFLKDISDSLSKLKFTKNDFAGSLADGLKELSITEDVAGAYYVANGTKLTGDEAKRFNGSTYASNTAIVGGKGLYVTLKSAKVGSDNIIANAKVALTDYAAKPAKFDSAKDVKALTLAEIIAIAEAVEETAEQVRLDKGDLGKRKGAINDFIKAMDAVNKDYADAAGEDYFKGNATSAADFKALKKVFEGVTNLSKSAMEPGLSLSRQALTSSSAALAYASKSLSNIKTAK